MTKALISFAVTAKLICAFVFAYAKSRFSHDVAHLVTETENNFQTFIYFGFQLIDRKPYLKSLN